MWNGTDGPVIHCYDVVRRQVLCGSSVQTHSTKHAGAVTCLTCRELLGRAAAADRPVGAAAPHDG